LVLLETQTDRIDKSLQRQRHRATGSTVSLRHLTTDPCHISLDGYPGFKVVSKKNTLLTIFSMQAFWGWLIAT
jgi:hypothetical protein